MKFLKFDYYVCNTQTEIALLLPCIECFSGYYGLKCTKKCDGHCKDNEPCNHINGTCDNGCLDGWIGVNCDKRMVLNIKN